MHNFGRGMWRRVGDYERIQSPQLLQQVRIQQYLALMEQKKVLQQKKQREDTIKIYRDQTILKVNSENNVHELNIKETEIKKDMVSVIEKEVDSWSNGEYMGRPHDIIFI